MLIESIIVRRNGGTAITMESRGERRIYHFRGPIEGPHVCNVEDEDDCRTLLAVPSAYRPFDGDTPPAMTKEEQDIADRALAAHLALEEDRSARKGLRERILAEDREAPLSERQKAQLAEIRSAQEAEVDIKTVRAAYIAKMNKKPGPKWTIEQMRAAMQGETT